jgi:hypothetical protein
MKINRESQMQLCNEYLKSMTEKELKAYEIAKSHLGDSFQLEKSIGFLDWIKKNASTAK